jgi:hypothetical protein
MPWQAVIRESLQVSKAAPVASTSPSAPSASLVSEFDGDAAVEDAAWEEPADVGWGSDSDAPLHEQEQGEQGQGQEPVHAQPLLPFPQQPAAVQEPAAFSSQEICP